MEVIFPGWTGPGDAADLARKVAACDRLTTLATSLQGRDLPLRNSVSGSPPPGAAVMPIAVFDEFGRTVKTFRACVHLASIGFSQPSHVLAAVVVQSSLIVIWASEEGESVDARADLHARFRRQLDLDERRRLGLGMWATLPEDEHVSPEERTEAAAIFGSDALGLWTGHPSLSALIDDLANAQDDAFMAAKVQGLKVVADYAASLLLGTGLANQAQRSEIRVDGRVAAAVNLGPSPEGCTHALHAAVTAFLPCLGTVVEKYASELSDELRRCEAFTWRAWKDPALLAGLSDDDPCPCDQPGTLWGACHKWTNQLGTTSYVPLTDSDLVNFVPWDPKKHQPPDFAVISDPMPGMPAGPLILTYSFRLPFALGMEDGAERLFGLKDSWADPDDVGHFGMVPVVRVKFLNQETDQIAGWPVHAPEVLARFFDLPEIPDVGEFEPQPNTYEQWVTIETPSGRLESEDPEDSAYAFRRGFETLNTFLTVLDLAVSDSRVSSVSTHEIGPIVFCGARTQADEWVQLPHLVMHPESYPPSPKPQTLADMRKQLDGSYEDLRDGRPFITAALWHDRALKAHGFRGDNVDCIISLQTAAESLMYDLLRSLLVDLGKSSKQIASRANADLPFRSLVTKEIPPLLGGDWNPEGNGFVGRYWRAVYLVRNRIVHAGYQPNNREAIEALEIYLQFREYISKLLWQKNARYPRTLVCKVGENGLVRRGWMTGRMKAQLELFRSEPGKFYWPRDISGR